MNITRSFLIDQIFEKHPIYQYKVNILLSIFKWEYRKGWDILLDVYFHSFTRHDAISLFIVSQSYHDTSIVIPSLS